MKRTPILLLFFFIFLTACECDDVFCPAFLTEHLAYVPPPEDSSIQFINGKGDKINFNLEDQEFSARYVNPAEGSKIKKCTTKPCDNTFYRMQARSNEGRNGSKLMIAMLHTVTSTKTSAYDARLQYVLFDFENTFSFLPSYAASATKDTTLPSVSFPNGTYAKVLRQEIDTMGTGNKNQQIWRVYLTAEKGIIGFEDRFTHSLFYLK